jgi:biotin carboxylase
MVIGGKLKVIQKARRLGLEVVYVQHESLFTDQHRPYVDHVALMDYTDVDRLVATARRLHQVVPFQRAISLTEPGLLPAAHVNDALRLAGNPVAVVSLLKDKSAMRRRLNAIGLSPVSAQVGRAVADVHAFIDRHGLPAVVKPVDATASRGVFRIDRREQASAACRALASMDVQRFLMEEYLDGPELSVETLSSAGRHVVVTLTDKLSAENFVELGHSIPSRVAGHQRERVRQAVTAFLDAVGLREGPAHTEVKLTSRGVAIVESHNRVGGDRINEMTALVCGVDMDTYALGCPFGLVAPLRETPVPAGGAAIRFMAARPGRVVAIEGAESVLADPALVELEFRVGLDDVVRPAATNFDRPGCVVARGASAGAAMAACERLLARVRIETTDAPALAAPSAAPGRGSRAAR